MSRCLVTGGAGLIGSHLVDSLVKAKHDVWIIDNLSTGNKSNLSPDLNGFFYERDLKDREVVELIVKTIQPEVVYHLAAFAHEGLSQFCPSLIIENNINASTNLLVALIRNKVKRFVFTSSIAVYGNQKAPFIEDMPRSPVDIYGITKATFENMLEVMSSVYGFEYCIFRPHNVFGSHQSLADPYRNVIGIFMNRILHNKPFFLYGEGEQRRSFSFVKDITPILMKGGFAPEAKNQIFNIGADRDYSINDLATMILSITGAKHLKPIYLPDRPQEVSKVFCSHDKVSDKLGFEDKTSLRDGLVEMWEWAQKQGPQKFKHLESLELTNDKTPTIWKNKTL